MTVHRLGFGAMRITGAGIWGDPKNPEEARRLLRRVVELGVDFIDTADSYGPEVSERLIAEALHPYPKNLIIGTKGGHTRPGPNKWAPVGRPEYLRQCVELSLRRLRQERIDLYQLHRFDPLVPMEETLGALKDMQAEGKIRHIGLSEVSVAEIERSRKTVAVVSVQNLYNMRDRKHEDVITYCEKHHIGFIPWFPIAGGNLVKPGGVLDVVAKRHGVTVSQLALAWLLHHSPMMMPIPGTASIAHFEENMGAATLKLKADEWLEIEKSVK